MANYVIPDHYFTDQRSSQIATDAYLLKFRDSEDAPVLNCSKSFIWDFKQHHRFSSHHAHSRRTDSSGDLYDLKREKD
jgi:hypothetical protein